MSYFKKYMIHGMMTTIYTDLAARIAVRDRQTSCCCCLERGRGWDTHTHTRTRRPTSTACTKGLAKRKNTTHSGNSHKLLSLFAGLYITTQHHLRYPDATQKGYPPLPQPECGGRHAGRGNPLAHQTNGSSRNALVSQAEIHTHTQRPSIFWFP